MLKFISIVVLLAILIVIFISPIRNHITGLFHADQAKFKMRNEKIQIERKIDVHDEVLGYRLKTLNRTKQIQMALKKAGFYKGEIDGKIGHQTRVAIQSFQKAKGLDPDGIVGPKTWEELSKYLKD